MTFATLVSNIAPVIGLTQKGTRDMVAELLMAVERGVIDHGRVSIPGFGTFTLRTRKGRRLKSPSTGEWLEVPPFKALHFSPAAQLKKRINA